MIIDIIIHYKNNVIYSVTYVRVKVLSEQVERAKMHTRILSLIYLTNGNYKRRNIFIILKTDCVPQQFYFQF